MPGYPHEDKDNILVHPVLMRDGLDASSSTDVVLNVDAVFRVRRLRWLLERGDGENRTPLTKEQLSRLDLARLSSPEEIDLILVIRGDVVNSKEWPNLAQAGRRSSGRSRTVDLSGVGRKGRLKASRLEARCDSISRARSSESWHVYPSLRTSS